MRNLGLISLVFLLVLNTSFVSFAEGNLPQKKQISLSQLKEKLDKGGIDSLSSEEKLYFEKLKKENLEKLRDMRKQTINDLDKTPLSKEFFITTSEKSASTNFFSQDPGGGSSDVVIGKNISLYSCDYKDDKVKTDGTAYAHSKYKLSSYKGTMHTRGDAAGASCEYSYWTRLGRSFKVKGQKSSGKCDIKVYFDYEMCLAQRYAATGDYSIRATLYDITNDQVADRSSFVIEHELSASDNYINKKGSNKYARIKNVELEKGVEYAICVELVTNGSCGAFGDMKLHGYKGNDKYSKITFRKFYIDWD